jgi:hypothetical protein
VNEHTVDVINAALALVAFLAAVVALFRFPWQRLPMSARTQDADMIDQLRARVAVLEVARIDADERVTKAEDNAREADRRAVDFEAVLGRQMVELTGSVAAANEDFDRQIVAAKQEYSKLVQSGAASNAYRKS